MLAALLLAGLQADRSDDVRALAGGDSAETVAPPKVDPRTPLITIGFAEAEPDYQGLLRFARACGGDARSAAWNTT